MCVCEALFAQSCLTPCNHIEYSLLLLLSHFSRVQFCQAPMSTEFSRQEYWIGLPFPSPGDLPDSGIIPGSPALQADSLSSEAPGKSYMYVWQPTPVFLGFPGGWAGKESTYNAGDLGLTPGLVRSPGEGKGYPFQYSGLENSMDCIVQGVVKRQTRLSYFHFHSDSDPQGESQIQYSTLTHRILSSQVSNHL